MVWSVHDAASKARDGRLWLNLALAGLIKNLLGCVRSHTEN